MPQEWNGKIAVRKTELIPYFFSNDNHLDVTIRRHHKRGYGIKKLQGGGNGRELLIDFDSLDLEIRNALGDPRKLAGGNWIDKFFELDTEASRFYSDFEFENGGGLKVEHVEEYTVNASMLKACKLVRLARERDRVSKGGSLRGVPSTIWADAMNYKPIMKTKFGVVHTLPQNERRFLEALRKFEAEGFVSLISKKHNNANALKVTDKLIELLDNMFAGTVLKPTATQVAREYAKFLAGDIEVVVNGTGELIDPDEYPALGESTVMKWLGKWQNRIGTHKKRSGNAQIYNNNYKPTHSLDRPQFAGSLLSIDDRNPPFVMEDGKRVWFYNAIDLCSEVWTCWVHGRTKEGIIIDFYRQLVRNYARWGIGMSYELECEMSLNSSFVNSFLREGILFQKVRIEANNATGKKIESYYRQMRYGAEKDLEGWTARPFAKSEANQAKDEKRVTLPYDTIVKQTIKAMEDWNHAEHPIYSGKTRWEVFLERQNPKTVPINWKLLLPLLGHRTKSSCNTGFVLLQKQEYCLAENGKIATGENLIRLMKKVEGKDVVVTWLDDDNGNVLKALLWIGDMCYCELIEKPRYNRAFIERTEQCNINYALISAYSNTIISFGTQQAKGIEKVTILPKHKPEIVERVVEIMEPIDDDDFDMVVPTKTKSLLSRWYNID